MNGFVDIMPLAFNNFIMPPPPLKFGQGIDCFNMPSTSSSVLEPDFDIRDYVLTAEDQEQYDFPTPGPDCKWTKTVYADCVTNESPLFVLDCEMCRTTANILEVTRVSILTEKGDIVMDTLVQPPNKIVDHVTAYSGITAEMMDGVTTTLRDVHDAIDAVLPNDAILVGHSLNCDLKALKLAHPYCIDTSLEYNTSGDPMRRPKLRDMCATYLGRQIQKGQGGHCSVEDCAATMDLAQLKLNEDYIFGNVYRGFDPATFKKAPSKKRLLIGQAPARYRPNRCVQCAAPLRVDCSSRETCLCWWREDVYNVCVTCIADSVQQQY